MTIVARKYTTEQLKKIDAESFSVDTGASQEPGWYWQENDEDGDLETGPVGPLPTREAALADYRRF